jgi:hypothetical protein
MNDNLQGYTSELVDNNDRKVKYEFSDDFGNEFLVVFTNDPIGPKMKPMLGNSYEVTYFVKDGTGQWSVDTIVSTNIYRLMRTVLGDVLKDFLQTRPWVSTLRLEGLAKDGELGQTKRTKLYLRHLMSNPLPGFRIEQVSTNRINLIKTKI